MMKASPAWDTVATWPCRPSTPTYRKLPAGLMNRLENNFLLNLKRFLQLQWIIPKKQVSFCNKSRHCAYIICRVKTSFKKNVTCVLQCKERVLIKRVYIESTVLMKPVDAQATSGGRVTQLYFIVKVYKENNIV